MNLSPTQAQNTGKGDVDKNPDKFTVKGQKYRVGNESREIIITIFYCNIMDR